MEQSLYNIFKITTEDLDELFLKVKLENGDNINSDKIDEKLNEYIEKNMLDIYIDEISFYHFGHRLNPDNECHTGVNLIDLLKNENSLTSFLRSYGITFKINDRKLDLIYKGKKMSLDNPDSANVDSLRSRIGHNYPRIDYAFNGFMIRDSLLNNDYKERLSKGPELLIDLSNFLNEKHFLSEFKRRSTYYCYEYILPIEQVFFDKCDEFTPKEKQTYMLKLILDRLYMYKNNQTSNDDYSSIIRLGDYTTMKSKYYVSREKIE